MLTVFHSMLCRRRGVPGLGGVPGPGGCTWSWGMYLVWGGVPGPGGECTWSWGVPGPGGYLVTWSGVYLVQGVYLIQGVYLVWGVPGPGGCTWSGHVPGLGGHLVWGPGGVPGPGGWWCQVLPPPVNRMTNRCKNITLPQTSFAGGKKIPPVGIEPGTLRLWDLLCYTPMPS